MLPFDQLAHLKNVKILVKSQTVLLSTSEWCNSRGVFLALCPLWDQLCWVWHDWALLCCSLLLTSWEGRKEGRVVQPEICSLRKGCSLQEAGLHQFYVSCLEIRQWNLFIGVGRENFSAVTNFFLDLPIPLGQDWQVTDKRGGLFLAKKLLNGIRRCRPMFQSMLRRLQQPVSKGRLLVCEVAF